MKKKIYALVLLLMFLAGLWFRLYGLKPLEINTRTIQVHLDGEVVNPGLYSIDEATRLGELVALAGGLTEDAQDINLAEKLLDGEKIIIPRIYREEESDNEDKEHKQTRQGLQALSREDWLEIPGVGQVTAGLIMDYLEKNPGAQVEDLINVSGIGQKKLDIIKEHLGNR
ncbi:MAG: hypothetical protein GX079_04170 [Tissierellia bacterium]|nr:hypothetical protein [Tissierellia bacterium]